MNNKIVIGILILVVAVFGIIWWIGQGADPVISPGNGEEQITEDEDVFVEDEFIEEDVTDPFEDVEVREFNVEGFDFGFSPDEIRVSIGETIRINFTNTGNMPHDLVIDQFNAQTELLSSGESDSITFTATDPGTFEYYCSVPGHREQGMVGVLIVE